MTLTTHAIVGSVVVGVLPHDPALGFSLAFVSHFVLDAIPHTDYKIESLSIHPHHGAKMKYDRALLRDFFRIGGDALIGLVLAFFIFAPLHEPWLIFLGVVGGMLPDALQFVHMRLRREPLAALQRFHHFIHKGSDYFKMSEHRFLGIISQSAFLIGIIIFANYFVL